MNQKNPKRVNPKSLQNLKSWKPGQTGNPQGKPHGKHSSTILSQILKIKLDVEIPDKNDKDQKIKRLTIKEAVLWKLVKRALNGSHAATIELLNRVEGSIPQEIYGQFGIIKKEEFDYTDEQTQELLKQLYIRKTELSGTGEG
jgi:hypothetical protein